jgi:hypothetical protein
MILCVIKQTSLHLLLQIFISVILTGICSNLQVSLVVILTFLSVPIFRYWLLYWQICPLSSCLFYHIQVYFRQWTICSAFYLQRILSHIFINYEQKNICVYVYTGLRLNQMPLFCPQYEEAIVVSSFYGIECQAAVREVPVLQSTLPTNFHCW